MRFGLAVLALCACASAASGQQATSNGTGAELRALDKLNGTVRDVVLPESGVERIGRIEIEIRECRYPEGDPAGDAFAFLTVREAGQADPVFRGWMIATAPALNPMDHPRYDVWVMRCTTS
ncbi:hypothetical protein OCH239_05040 [Roseivivax halodurans JCM 10272]|uniref:DUF2155 domain-containing protein n=1 Tax=Roseivivax halodurans JCM 10272 TaxID=1449350 RepID=X7EEB0_9RHOB|nr:DUF2155 domain-containing protein [Roseivivax halodurans]ETX14220.1 hypothetical protein OCH239_05040 [Roseivivax halodurans JCM 10272]